MRPDPHAELPAVPVFGVGSGVVTDGVTMPVAQRSGIFRAGGQDVSPDLMWSGFPATTRSFIVTSTTQMRRRPVPRIATTLS